MNQFEQSEQPESSIQNSQVKGLCSKQTKRILDNLSKVNKDDVYQHFYVCIKSDLLMFITLGPTQSHYFEISKDIEIAHSRPGSIKVVRVDITQFQLIVQTFQIGSSYQFETQDCTLLIQNENKISRTDQDVQLQVELQIYHFNQSETDTIQYILNVEQNDILFSIKMESASQLKIVLQQIKALKTEVVCIEVEPKVNKYMAWYYDRSSKQTMKYIFSNFTIESSVTELQKYHYNGKEMIQALNLIDKDNTINLLVKNSGALIIKQECQESVSYSILKNTIVSDLN